MNKNVLKLTPNILSFLHLLIPLFFPNIFVGNLIPIEKLYNVEVPMRLLNYGSVAWAVIVFVPLIWELLAILP